MNEENLPLPQNQDIEKDKLGYHYEGGCKEDFVLHMSSVNYKELQEYNDNKKANI